MGIVETSFWIFIITALMFVVWLELVWLTAYYAHKGWKAGGR